MSGPVRDALVVVGSAFPSESSLMDSLAADAAMARAAGGEVRQALHRLIELTSSGQLGDRRPVEIFDLLVGANWLEWEIPQVRAVTGWAHAWWRTVLFDFPGEQRAADRLGELVHLGLPIGGWLSVWLDELDGPAALHLADFVIDGSSHPAWSDRTDELGQLEAWTRSEPVIVGLTTIGGVHLPPGVLGKVLDRIVVTPGLA